MRSSPLLLACLLALTTAPLAQETPFAPEAYVLPFASGGHTLELEVGASPLAVKQGTQAVRVDVQSAPAWVVFASPEAVAAVEGGEPLARLSFSVTREAPVGEVGEIRVTVVSGGAVVGEKVVRVEVAAPEAAELGLPRPNPSRGEVVIPYAVPLASASRLVVVDVLGREVAVLASGDVSPGAHVARVPGGSLAAGVYAVVLTVEGAERQRRVRRLTVVR